MSDLYPEDLLYTKDHEWAKKTDKTVRVGITSFAVEQLGDVTQIEFPEVGDAITRGEVFGAVESVKSVSDLFAPVSGTVKQINEQLNDTPEQVNDSPYQDGWLIDVEITDPEQMNNLLSAADYQALLDE